MRAGTHIRYAHMPTTVSDCNYLDCLVLFHEYSPLVILPEPDNWRMVPEKNHTKKQIFTNKIHNTISAKG